MVTELVQRLEAQIHASAIGRVPGLEWFVDNALNLLTSPFTGIRTRSYWPELVAALLIAALVFVLREPPANRRIRNFLQFCLPSSMWRHRSTWVDCQIIVLNQFFARSFNLTWRINGALFVGVLVSILTWSFGPSPHLLTWTPMTLVLYTVVLALADDFGYYIFHLASHRIPFLWSFHKVHHSAETLTVLANVRVHPIEYAVIGPCKAVTVSLVFAPALYLGTGQATTIGILGMNLMAAFFCVTGTQLHHSHIWISWGRVLEHVFISPAQHQIHHSTAPRHWNRNMGGNFALWDWMFGTLYVPNGREQLTFGLGEGVKQPYNNGLAAYAIPFWEILPGRRMLPTWENIRLQFLRLSPLPLLRRLFADPAHERPVASQPPR
jgi:sterol desaturase/sphingolipid hydroxylase (fatty acid hydroxylase superfamily)